ncbi:MAG: RidA family protein [Tetragenococcus sp.]|nr:RidA family protein [Tetragenococcus sp.]
MAKRKVIKISGSEHDNPIPAAVKIGNMVYTSAIIGNHPETGQIPETVEQEITFIFQYMEEIMNKAGGSTDDIAHLSVYVIDRKLKQKVNVEWLNTFPNPDDRPARHTTVKDLKPGVNVQVEMVAVL